MQNTKQNLTALEREDLLEQNILEIINRYKCIKFRYLCSLLSYLAIEDQVYFACEKLCRVGQIWKVEIPVFDVMTIEYYTEHKEFYKKLSDDYYEYMKPKPSKFEENLPELIIIVTIVLVICIVLICLLV